MVNNNEWEMQREHIDEGAGVAPARRTAPTSNWSTIIRCRARPTGHVVIRVRASSFNYHDVFTVRGMPGIKVPLPVMIGLDMAGEIAEVGAGVTGWKTGDRVLVNPLNKKKGLMGEMLDGGMAEYCRGRGRPARRHAGRCQLRARPRRCRSPTAPRTAC